MLEKREKQTMLKATFRTEIGADEYLPLPLH